MPGALESTSETTADQVGAWLKLADSQATFSELKTTLAKAPRLARSKPDMLARAERPGAMLWQVDLLIAELEPSLGTP